MDILRASQYMSRIGDSHPLEQLVNVHPSSRSTLPLYFRHRPPPSWLSRGGPAHRCNLR